MEKAKKGDRRVNGEELNGKGGWCTRPARRRSPRTSTEPGWRSYFPPAVQSFDVAAGRIQRIYLGPVKFFFDGPFVWREKLNVLEFTFTRVSLRARSPRALVV